MDFHFTGKVRKINNDAIRQALARQAVVLISPIGFSNTGELFNLSSAELAVRVAISLQADKFICFIQDDGLRLTNGELLKQISVSQCRNLLDTNQIDGDEGKQALQHCFHAGDNGVARAQVISYRENGALLEELFTTNGRGSLIHSDSYEVVRTATIDDVGGILALITPLEQQGVLVRRSRELLESEIAQFTVVEIDGLIIGCAAVYGYSDNGMAELAAVVTHPEHQGLGLGAKLLGHIEQKAAAEGFTQLFVLTTQTAHWFLENGFKPGDLSQVPEQKQSLYNFQRRSKIFIKSLS